MLCICKNTRTGKLQEKRKSENRNRYLGDITIQVITIQANTAMEKISNYSENQTFEICKLWLPLSDIRVRGSLMCLPRVSENVRNALCMPICQLELI